MTLDGFFDLSADHDRTGGPNGVGAGVITYTLIKTAQGRAKEAGWLLWIISAVFVVYFGLSIVGEVLGVK